MVSPTDKKFFKVNFMKIITAKTQHNNVKVTTPFKKKIKRAQQHLSSSVAGLSG
jgi:hypothetical protein